MICNLLPGTLSAMAAFPRPPSPIDVDAEGHEARQRRPSAITDVLSIGANPTLAIYLSGLFEESGWTVRRAADLTAAQGFLENNRAAVAICEEDLPGAASWQDALRSLQSVPDAPMFMVITSEKSLLTEVLALGGFDVLVRPLRESEVIWTVASARHQWMKRLGGQEGEGLPYTGA